jgi:hypothetical protein
MGSFFKGKEMDVEGGFVVCVWARQGLSLLLCELGVSSYLAGGDPPYIHDSLGDDYRCPPVGPNRYTLSRCCMVAAESRYILSPLPPLIAAAGISTCHPHLLAAAGVGGRAS